MSKYFASLPTKEAAPIIMGKITAWQNSLDANGYIDKVKRSWAKYHGASYEDLDNGHQITFQGEQGELVSIKINHFRNIAQNMLVLTTTNRPALDSRSINTDYKSLVQTKLANGLLDYYMREKRMENYIRNAVEYGIVLGSGYVKMEWNSNTGKVYDFNEETNTPIYEGDVVFTNLSCFDVIFDPTKEHIDHDWIITRSFKNKYDLAAKYPEYEDKIISLGVNGVNKTKLYESFGHNDSDDIPIYEFYHKRTESMPDGRYLLMLSDDIIPLDSPLPYRRIPVYRVAPSNILGTPFGYTPMFDILPIQDAVDSLYSTILTNQTAFGVQNVVVPKGADVNVNSLAGGLNIIEMNMQMGRPEPLNLTATPAEIFNFLTSLERTMETISGVNSVARGNPEPSLRSGSALALVQSMTLQFMSGLQQEYVKLMEDLGTGLVDLLKDFASVPRVAMISGKSNRPYMKEFVGEDLGGINRVVVDVGNPLMKCLKRDTPVLMFDGSFKMVQDIVAGDEVMGPDSKKRTVESSGSGEEMMYDIHHKSEKNDFIYGCNESHIMSLKYCSNDGRYGLKQGQIVDISVKEFLSLPERQQRLFMGYRTGVEFSKKETIIPSYILGLWLGDGHSAVPALTSMDEELINEWSNYAKSLDLNIRIQDQGDNKSKVYFITSGEAHGSSDRNQVVNNLKKLNLIDNKHIPFDYLTTSREDRLQLLAGLLDSDGTLIDQTFVITQKNNHLSDNIIYLARSLGFKVTSRKVERELSDSIGIYNSITIGGNTWEIPTKLKRKQAQEVEKHRDWLNYGIEIVSKGIGTYYGFTLIEEPHFIIGDFTVTHNTTAGRVQMADNLLQYGVIKDPRQYFEVISTGNLDVATEDLQRQDLLIKGENEMLVNGEKPSAVAVDEHAIHIMNHRGVLSDPDLRKDPVLVQNTLDHIQEHIELLKNTDPNLLMLLGQQPLQQAPMMPPGAGELPPGTQGNPALDGMTGQNVVPGEISGMPGQEMMGPGIPENVNLPSMPQASELVPGAMNNPGDLGNV